MTKNTPSKNSADPIKDAIHKFSKARPLAARHGICARTLFRFADRGLIHRFKVNPRIVVFDEGEVAALFQSARVDTAGEGNAVPATKARCAGN